VVKPCELCLGIVAFIRGAVRVFAINERSQGSIIRVSNVLVMGNCIDRALQRGRKISTAVLLRARLSERATCPRSSYVLG
jgi:hypothetical protein